MCLIFIAVRNHPAYKLIVAGNRDEFYNRPTSSADFWKDDPNVLAGRDLEAGGTWMGVTKTGKISMLTNYRDPQHINPQAPSRGQLVADFLKGNEKPGPYLERLAPTAAKFNGFNLLVGDADELWYYSNYQNGVHKLVPGFYGISNRLLNTPWPKVVRGKQTLGPVLEKSVLIHDDILNALYDDLKAPADQLPETGLAPSRELALSPMFIKTENYGTRCSTVVSIDFENNLSFSERVYDVRDFSYTTKRFQLKLKTG